MAEANVHYYATRDPLGVSGDFTTAPEISQMFGELVGVALADCWARAGKPDGARFVELGPGRGTLSADVLRVMASAGLTPPVEFVETSPVLRAAQAQRVPQARSNDSLSDLPGGPLLLVANEFLDAVAVRQWSGDEERRIALDGDRLCFTSNGPIREDSPARDEVVSAISNRLCAEGGVALIIDYGHTRSDAGDTLQAVRDHRFADPLADPGEQDLTAHVDFERVAAVAIKHGVRVCGPVGQGEWLERLGIGHRSAMIAAASPGRAAEIDAARLRLTGEEAMGRLFKVIALVAPDWPEPAGFAG